LAVASNVLATHTMRRIVAIAGLLVTTATARADVETREGQQRELGLPSRFEVTTGGFTWQAFAQLAGGGAGRRDAATQAEATAAIGAELRVVDEACDLVRLGGQARLAWTGSANPSAEQWAHGCLAFDETMFEVGHHLEWDVRPALLAPLRLRAGANRRETATFHWEPVRVPLTYFYPIAEQDRAPAGHLVIFDVRVAWAFEWTSGGDVVDRPIAEAVPFRYARERTTAWGERRDYTVDVGVGGAETREDAMTVGIWLVRLQHHDFGPVLASAGLGVASASDGALVSEFEREVEITTPRVLVGFEGGNRRAHGHLRFTHDVGLAADGFTTVESRLASALRVDIARTRLGLDAALGRTTAHIPGVMPTVGWTGGGSLSLAHGLGPHLDAALQVDVARSFYAPDVELATSTAPVPRWGVQALATLQARIGR
jgi:hypothetical protein